MSSRTMRRGIIGLLAAVVVIAGTMAPAGAVGKGHDPGAQPGTGVHALRIAPSASGTVAPQVTPATGTGSIGGTVSGPSGTDLTNIAVYAVDASDVAVAGGWADSAGNYTVSGLDSGTYKVFFDASYTAQYESHWWNGTSAGTNEIGAASSVSVGSGATAGVNANLVVAGGSITGTLTGSSKIAAGMVAACTIRDDGFYTIDRCGTVAADGTYSLASLRPGNFVIGFVTNVTSKTIGSTSSIGRTVWWNSELDLETSDDLAVPTPGSGPAIANQSLSTTAGLTTFPKVSGTPKVGVQLSVSSGAWPAGTSLHYRWYANGTPITGATSSKFTPTASQLGKSLSVDVYAATNFAPWLGFADEYMTTAKTAAVASGTLTTSTPTITGTRAVGFTLTANPGTWTSGTSFSYKWYANGTYITGTTGHKTFTLTSAQKGTKITVKVTGTKSGYTTASRTSASTLKIPLTAKPTITGTMKVGYTLTAHHNTWTSGTAFTYRWYANGVFITGATHSTFKLTSAQRGKTIKVKVTGTLSGYETIGRTSSSTVAIS